jgi:hypothetical protein
LVSSLIIGSNVNDKSVMVRKGNSVSESINHFYNTDLDRNPANFQPLTPLIFLERAATVMPDRIAIIHGQKQIT